MKWGKRLLVLFCSALFAGIVCAADAAPEKPIVVACCGDSITQGVGVSKPEKESYPAVLQQLLGDNYKVLNFGVGGRTLLRKQDPYSIGNGLNANPDIVIIALGTNDAREETWKKFGAEFVGDYSNLIGQFRTRPARKPEIFVVLPPPIFAERWQLRDEVLNEKIIPAIRQVAQENGVTVIDFNAPMREFGGEFPDGVHPNAAAAAKLAEIAAQAIRAAEVLKQDQ